MGKNRHSKDKLYIIASEHARDWGGYKKKKEGLPFRVLPFDCCAYTLSPFKNPVVTRGGMVFDIDAILKFIRVHKKNPVDGTPLTPKMLTPLKFHKNSSDEYACPVTHKVFTAHSHIVANAVSGNVYLNEAVDHLCRKPNSWIDPMSDEPFTPEDIIHIQAPHNLERRNLELFKHLEDVNENTDERGVATKAIVPPAPPQINETSLMTKIMTAHREEQKDSTSFSSIDPTPAGSMDNPNGLIRHGLYTTDRHAASFTSTVIDGATGGKTEYRPMTDYEVRKIVYDKVRDAKEKGYVQLDTSVGPLNIELHTDMAPLACDNFLRHCETGYYKDTIFHRCIKNFIIQGGDPLGTGTGGESAFGAPFRDEYDNRLKHMLGGVVSMANGGKKHDNKSQFYITFKSCEHLDNRHTVFGKVVGGGPTLKAMEGLETDKKDRPKVPPKILKTTVFRNPFKDDKYLKDMEEPKKEEVEEKKRPPHLPDRDVQNNDKMDIGRYLKKPRV
eukprot:GHVO01005363.1.p1 GENE.GHVO01005363.1~~GHVO01005363.1.p1  ORF type:complete len:500 (+),score=117.91 GHVO01005363.1:21-1520(+)